MVWLRIREYFHLNPSSLLGSHREKPFVPGGGWLCEGCACYLTSPPTSLRSAGKYWNQCTWSESRGLAFLLSPFIPPRAPWHVECGRKVSCLWVFVFCYFASRLVSKTTCRTSHQTPCSLERNWPLPFQSVNNFSSTFFLWHHLRRKFLKSLQTTCERNMNTTLKFSYMLFPVPTWNEKGTVMFTHVL